MTSKMHFRKRILMDYELETMFGLVMQSSNNIEYPSSPSSMNSPVKDEIMECVTPGSQQLFNSNDALQSFAHDIKTPIKSSYGSSSQIFTENYDDVKTPIKTECISPTKSSQIFAVKREASTNEISASYAVKLNSENSFKSPTTKSQRFEGYYGQTMTESSHQSRIQSPPRNISISKGNSTVSVISPSFIKGCEPYNRSLLDQMYLNLKSEIKSSTSLPQLVKSISNDVHKPPPSFQMKLNPTDIACKGKLFNQIGIDLSSIKSRLELERKRLLDQESVKPKFFNREVSNPVKFQPTTSKNNTESDDFRSISTKIDAIFAFANYSKQRMDRFESSGVKIIIEDTPKSSKKEVRTYPIASPDNENEIIIGPNGTKVHKSNFLSLDWSRPVPTTTRKLLMAVFDRETLATHTLTGRPSPAFMEYNKPEKSRLDPAKISDIAYLMNLKNGALEREVRMTITTKCADECKMRKMRMEKKSKNANKENDLRVKPY